MFSFYRSWRNIRAGTIAGEKSPSTLNTPAVPDAIVRLVTVESALTVIVGVEMLSVSVDTSQWMPRALGVGLSDKLSEEVFSSLSSAGVRSRKSEKLDLHFLRVIPALEKRSHSSRRSWVAS